VTLALTSCGSSPSTTAGGTAKTTATAKPTPTGTPAKSPVGEPDVTFAKTMIAAHTQSIAMVELALKRTTNAKVKELAPEMTKAEAPELARMKGWYTSVGNTVPGAAEMPGMEGMASHPVGVLSAKEMTDLGKATASGFDQMWLKLMVKHHQGALAASRKEVAKGLSADVKQLAQEIIDRQSTEIAAMAKISG
jgi:uncharacterized protein (DUF305 family)